MILNANLFKDKSDVNPSSVYFVGNYDDLQVIVKRWLTIHPTGKVEFVIRNS